MYVPRNLQIALRKLKIHTCSTSKRALFKHKGEYPPDCKMKAGYTTSQIHIRYLFTYPHTISIFYILHDITL